ncbi:hepatocellular carcinoma-associated antigen 59-domain-containing protein [Radiomyces spectabilis]|uniref:hepatocellular carcinoma-associated antigen 59-domain-containing protein n=1 Tax=Radiomyces spectabilis TaxID=64574 RepID=UPI00221E4097|nr:hepatocellular carcinoma-associated antigen 59-domain-containing protein [Radiomyces spectabilis]KAI8374444.1 hepatocellular carcinoma-associated antigen 59-domain-containing protein [Radiomyces spectabilis]
MPMVKKQRNYRKKKLDSDEESDLQVLASDDNQGEAEDISATIEELQELRRLRKKHGGIDAEKLFKGVEKKKKKKSNDDAWNLKLEGLVDKDALRAGNDEDGAEKKLKLDSFTTQTNAVDVDKHMMAYIEQELRKRRGETYKADEAEEEQKTEGLKDIYEELYRVPERLQTAKKRLEEGNVQLSTQMLTAIPEVDLGIDVRLKNIEETERAKRKLMDESQEEANKPPGYKNELNVPANFEKQIRTPETKPRLDKRQMATDELVAEKFKKRMRK